MFLVILGYYEVLNTTKNVVLLLIISHGILIRLNCQGKRVLQVACRMKNTGTNSNLELSKEMKKLLKR